MKELYEVWTMKACGSHAWGRATQELKRKNHAKEIADEEE
ncbi:hypothetical protein J2TS4_32790 [Paenibacillus sp. J2TS4]|nr:hypothetical protein J2TS4_32790 [Paenibacillus sp. J2TS4]